MSYKLKLYSFTYLITNSSSTIFVSDVDAEELNNIFEDFYNSLDKLGPKYSEFKEYLGTCWAVPIPNNKDEDVELLNKGYKSYIHQAEYCDAKDYALTLAEEKGKVDCL